MDVAAQAAAIERELAKLATPGRAEQEKRYLKSEIDHLGVTLPDLRSLLKRFLKEHRSLTREEEKEFFIRKAIGWVLREVAYRRPALAAAFIRQQAARASGVTLREAIRNLPDREGKAILALAKAKIRLPARRRDAR